MKNKVVIFVVVLGIIIMMAIICKNLFSGSGSSRIKSNEKFSLSNNEKNSIVDKFEELDAVSSVKVKANVKIIKIIVTLEEDIDFEQVKKVSNESLSLISEKNLGFFDVEIYIKSKNKDSETYPQIGYKHKSKEEFSW